MKLISLTTLFLLLFTVSNSVSAYNTFDSKSDSLLKKYTEKTIYLTGNSNKFIHQSQKKRIGVFGKRLAKFFGNISPDASNEIQIYASQYKAGYFLFFLGMFIFTLTLFSSALILATGAYLFLFSLSFIIYMWGIIKIARAPEYLNRAIWYYNRDVIAK
ncbi:MAG: hypothetical protein V4667_04345 [Bacteroidota bacterium]